MPTHDDLQQRFGSFGREALHAEVIQAQQVGLQVPRQRPARIGRSRVGLQLAHQFEDRAVQHLEVGPEGRITDGLGDVALAKTRGPQQEHVAAFAHELRRGQLEDLGPVDLRIELPVEVLQGLKVRELRELLASLQAAVAPDVEFVLEKQFEELPVGDAMGGRLVEAQFEAGSQSGQAELATGVLEWIRHGFQ